MKAASDEPASRVQCPKCFARFNNTRGLASHMITHDTQMSQVYCTETNSGYNCKSCNLVFAYQNEFIQHYEKKLQCHFCKESIPCLTLYAKHMSQCKFQIKGPKTTRGTVSCSSCSMQFGSVNVWRAHERKRVCGICKAEENCLMKHSVHLASHFESVNDVRSGIDELTCKLCHESFVLPTDFYQHTKGMTCHFSYCDETFKCTNIDAYYDHIINHRQIEETPSDEIAIPSDVVEHICKHCEWRFPSGALLHTHKRRYNLNCHLCDLPQSCMLALSRHLKTHRDQTGHEDDKLVCKQCNNSYLTKAAFVHHTRGHKCVCQVVFSCFMGVSEHLRRHVTVNLPLTAKNRGSKDSRPLCEHCKRSFLTPHQFSRHKKGYRCHICNAMFPCSGYQMFSIHVFSHVSTKFEPPEIDEISIKSDYSCDHCYWNFPSQFHLAKHTEKKEMCYICYQLLPCLLTLSFHLLIHVNLDENSEKCKYVCKHCNIAFEDSESLFTHTTGHKCPLCRKRFPCFVDVAYHIRKHVDDVWNYDNASNGAPSNGENHDSTEPVIWCDFCKLGFVDSEAFGAHRCDKEVMEDTADEVFGALMVNE